MPYKRDIIYPIFLSYLKDITDSFWKGVFEDLAYGISPKGTYITKGRIWVLNKKGERSSFSIEENSNKRFEASELIEFFTRKLCLRSQFEKDKQLYSLKCNDECENLCNWASIRKKILKEMIIEKYVIEMKITHNLSIKQSKSLMMLILSAITFKSIKPSDIVLDNGEIKSIIGIEFKNKTFSSSIKDKINNKKEENVPRQKKSVNSIWKSYCV